MTFIAAANEKPWKETGWFLSTPEPVGVFPDGRLLYARGTDTYEFRQIEEPDGSMYWEQRIQGTGTMPYRKLIAKPPPWKTRTSWLTGRRWQERSWWVGDEYKRNQCRADENSPIEEWVSDQYHI